MKDGGDDSPVYHQLQRNSTQSSEYQLTIESKDEENCREEANAMCQARRSCSYDREHIEQRPLTITSLPEWL